jgi:hypothetical protein
MSSSMHMSPPKPIPPELFLTGYPPEIGDVAERLRGVVREAVPEAIERVRTGWRLIGYDVPVGRRTRYFAFVAPEPEHVHLGFEYGIWMTDPDDLLLGAHLNLRKVRYVTNKPGDEIPTDALVRYTREAAALAAIGNAARAEAPSGLIARPGRRPPVRPRGS